MKINLSKTEGPRDYPWVWKTKCLMGSTGIPITWSSSEIHGSPDALALTALAPALKERVLGLEAELAALSADNQKMITAGNDSLNRSMELETENARMLAVIDAAQHLSMYAAMSGGLAGPDSGLRSAIENFIAAHMLWKGQIHD